MIRSHLRRVLTHTLAIAIATQGLPLGAYAQTSGYSTGYGGSYDTGSYNMPGTDANTGAVRLRQAATANTVYDANGNPIALSSATTTRRGVVNPPYQPGEFEIFVNKIADSLKPTAPQFMPSARQQRLGADGRPIPGDSGSTGQTGQASGAAAAPDLLGTDPYGHPWSLAIRRFGADLVTDRGDDAADFGPQVPPDYLLTPGDEVQLNIWGSVDADLRLVVDRAGRLNIPRVGAVPVAGVRYADLPGLLTQRVGQQFRNFQLSVTLGQLRGIRVYVTGFLARPGSYTVSSLSTIVNALMRAGGPSAAGSFRNIELRRAGKLVSTLDLYALLIKGDRSGDRVLQAEDVIHIGAVGPQAAVIGSVNKPAIFELKPGETVQDMLAMSGGLNAVADRTRLAVERLDERIGAKVAQLALPADLGQRPSNGDVLRAFSAVEATLPQDKQNKRVRIEGEVARPGDYILPPATTIADAIRAAGGLTPDAYVFGTEFSRESVRLTQQDNYDRALRDLEVEFARVTTTQRALSADEAQAQAGRASAATQLIERLRAIRPTGRVVLQLDVAAQSLPDLTVESGDRLYIPAKPTSVGVFGSVYNGGSYLWGGERRVMDYVQLAGGPTRGADDGGLFVVRANGSVVSARQRAGFFGFGGNLGDVPAFPGDTVFVPEELNKTSTAQFLREWTQILAQFALGAAAFKTLSN